MLPSTTPIARELPATPRAPQLSCARTDIGRREHNEDAVLADDQLRLYVVADGLGGKPGGATASRLGVQALWDTVRRYTGPGAEDSTRLRDDLRRLRPAESVLEHAVLTAHRAVMRAHEGELAEMATTIAAVHLVEDLAVVAHVGDSRVYRLRGERLEQLTRDHSMVNELLDLGSPLTAVQRANYAHVVMRALGVLRTAEPDVHCFAVERGDVLMLCTDGLHGVLSDTRIAELLGSGPPDTTAERLIRAAYTADSDDNISAVVVRVA